MVAAGVSAAVTITMLGLLLGRPASRPVAQTNLVAVRLIAPTPVSSTVPTHRAAPEPPVRPTRHTLAKPRAPSPSARALERVPLEPARAAPEPIRAEAQVDTQANTQAAAATTPSAEPAVPAASAPLRLDAATLRTAISQSKGLVQRPGTADSPAARLSAGIAGAAKKDCLAANGGGSLLSLPLIAYAAATGQCQ